MLRRQKCHTQRKKRRERRRKRKIEALEIRKEQAWDTVTSFPCLLDAYYQARKHKRYRKDVMAFTARLEDNLLAIQKALREGTYTIGPYRKKWVYVPKKRLVMALDFPDRIVQWSLYLYLNPIYDRMFIEDSYACRKGKGSHGAVARLQYWMQQVSRKPDYKDWYILKIDISKYFYRVDHEKLMEILGRRIKDPNMMRCIRGIIDSKEQPFGLPKGRRPDDTPYHE